MFSEDTYNCFCGDAPGKDGFKGAFLSEHVLLACRLYVEPCSILFSLIPLRT
jgi:hypothetical protein